MYFVANNPFQFPEVANLHCQSEPYCHFAIWIERLVNNSAVSCEYLLFAPRPSFYAAKRGVVFTAYLSLGFPPICILIPQMEPVKRKSRLNRVKFAVKTAATCLEQGQKY